MKYLKRIFENDTNYELIDIFSELELYFSVKIEYISLNRLNTDFEAIIIKPESETWGDKNNLIGVVPSLMLKIDSLIQKAENFGYNKLINEKLPWCLIEGDKGSRTKYKYFTTKCHSHDSITNWKEWWSIGHLPIDRPILLQTIAIYFEK